MKNNSFIFDLDGTLIDTVYQHVLAWKQSLTEEGLQVPSYIIHRMMGMSGTLITGALSSEYGLDGSPALQARLQDRHNEHYLRVVEEQDVEVLPGARELLADMSGQGIRWAIATSSSLARAQRAMDRLGVQSDLTITRDEVQRGKPDPDLFLAAVRRLGVGAGECVVVGDSTWDIYGARRAGILCVGLLTGGFSRDELLDAGALRVFKDPADLHAHMGELGVRCPPAAGGLEH